MQTLGYKNATPERADTMMRGWDWFTDNSVDDHGWPTYLDWMDIKIIDLLDDALDLYYGVKRPADARAASMIKRKAEQRSKLKGGS
jgi:hypothetical protein